MGEKLSLLNKIKEAQKKVTVIEEKKVPENKLERDHTEKKVDNTIIVNERPGIEKMKLDIIASFDVIKDALGVSDFAKALKELERSQNMLKEIEQKEKIN